MHFYLRKYCAVGSWEIEKDLLVFSQVKMDIFFNINGACKSIDVDTIHDVVIKTRKTSANNKSFSISQEPTHSQLHCIFSSAKWTFLQY